jgi:hypothetical protein
LAACSTAKVPVDETFRGSSTSMAVKGLNGWMVNQKLSFGIYETSAVKRGWDFTSSFRYPRINLRPDEALLRVLDIDISNNKLKQKNRFQYTIEDGRQWMEVYATEKFSEKQLVYKSNNPYIGNASKTRKYEYAFTAAIVPQTAAYKTPWSLVLVNSYDVSRDTAKKIFDRPYVEEEGYVTDGNETIAIRPLRIEKVTGKNGKEIKVAGGSLLGGYELSSNNQAQAVIDILNNNISIANDISDARKLLLSAIASSIMLKRMQDVEKDRDALEN